MGRSRRHKGYTSPIDQLGRSRTVLWVIADDQWGRVRDARRLDVGADLFDVLLAECLRYHRAGWHMTERPFFLAEFYIKRDDEPTALRVHFSGHDPALAMLVADGRYERERFYATFPSPGLHG